VADKSHESLLVFTTPIEPLNNPIARSVSKSVTSVHGFAVPERPDLRRVPENDPLAAFRGVLSLSDDGLHAGDVQVSHKGTAVR
jgi:hypothetical protein